MRKLFLFCLFLTFNLAAFAQLTVTDKKYPDSLIALTKSTSSDSIKARAFLRLSDYWSDKDTLKSKIFLSEGFKYGAKYPYVKAIYYFDLAGYNYLIDAHKSEVNYMVAERQFSRFNTNDALLYRAKCWSNFANLQQKKDNELLMIDILLNKSIPLVKKAGNDAYLGKYYYDLGAVFGNKNQYDKADHYFRLAISIFESAKLKNSDRLLNLYIATCENYLNDHKVTPGKVALDKARFILSKTTDPKIYVEYYEAEALYFREIKAYPRALQSISEGLKYARQVADPYLAEKIYYQKYRTLLSQGDYQNAVDVLENIIKKPASKFSVNTLTYYSDLANLYDKLGNSKAAYTWLKKYAILNDSLNKKDVLRKINQLEIKFKTAENQKKIAVLNTENEKARLAARNNHLIIWLLVVVSLLILAALIFGIYYYNNQKKITTQKEKIRLTNAMLQGQEKERYRVARDLHDGLGNILAVVKFNLWQFAKEKPAAELYEIIDQLDHSINELRRIAHDMLPEMLLNISLEAALKDLCESLTSEELDVECQFINIKDSIPQQTQIAVYRIVQELLTNVVKHAQAKNVFLQCTQNKHIFFITLEDDGKGFDANLQNEKTGIGLSNIKSRVAYLNGKIEILPKTNPSGTSINIELNVKA